MIPIEKHTDFEDIYLTYFSRMKYFAKEYVLADEDAENIVQDVFLELWEKRELINMPVNLVAYLFTAVKNRCIDLLRHRIIVQESAAKLQEEHQRTLQLMHQSLEAFDDSIFNENNLEEIVTKAINNLPEKCREIFIKNKIEGKKQKEIAEELNISINTIESQMAIAYRKLKYELKECFPLLFLFIHL